MFIIAGGTTALVVFLIWAISVTAANSSKIVGTLHSYSVKSENLVAVELQIDKTGQKATICQVEALANDYEVVGYREFEIPPGESSKTGQVLTVKPAVSAVVKDCWLK